ncbi:arylsulfatase [Halosquirtibacter xylanolyticus]|uniref:arylsulfatase n=1 Tax=Halosquirtibacter xylanolyticus TaxID=3374599 RepID=UPI003749BAC9|nr:arylsulfatase [Prolixibacteraceae bacterium]
MKIRIGLILLMNLVYFNLVNAKSSSQNKRPNVIIIMTDDQGLANIGFTGHPVLKTPNIDCFAEQAVQLGNFHQELLCSPSRSALLTGMYSSKTGAWRTSVGRSSMKTEMTTIAELFKENNYRTAHFGKWHLGDNYPMRPQDQGFEETLHHGAGGVGQIADHWGNDYSDDIYLHGEKKEYHKGYCTDVWFRETQKYIENDSTKPFFIYLATNAPHAPYICPKRDESFYTKRDVPKKKARYYGMIRNFDTNLGQFIAFLRKKNLYDNTIIVLTTDDGASAIALHPPENDKDVIYNAGLRGGKASPYNGGHKVFCFIKPTKSEQIKEKNIDERTGVWDITPTLVDFCNLKQEHPVKFDGLSICPLLRGKSASKFENRSLVVQLQGGAGVKWLAEVPTPYKESTIMHKRWHLVNGKELYDIQRDPSQKKDIAKKNPSVVRDMQRRYMEWYQQNTNDLNNPVRIWIGDPQCPVVYLTSQDHYTKDKNSIWHGRGAIKKDTNNGPWKIHVVRPGRYKITASRYPLYMKESISQNIQKHKKDFDVSKLVIKVDNKVHSVHVGHNDTESSITCNIPLKDIDILGQFISTKNKAIPTYFLKIEKL